MTAYLNRIAVNPKNSVDPQFPSTRVPLFFQDPVDGRPVPAGESRLANSGHGLSVEEIEQPFVAEGILEEDPRGAGGHFSDHAGTGGMGRQGF